MGDPRLRLGNKQNVSTGADTTPSQIPYSVKFAPKTVEDLEKKRQALEYAEAERQKKIRQQQKLKFAANTHGQALTHTSVEEPIAYQQAAEKVDYQREFMREPYKNSFLLAGEMAGALSMVPGFGLAKLGEAGIMNISKTFGAKKPLANINFSSIEDRDLLINQLREKHGDEFVSYILNKDEYKSAFPHGQWQYLDKMKYSIESKNLNPITLKEKEDQLFSLYDNFKSEVKTYYNSPKFKERFKKSFLDYRDIEDYKTETLDNLSRKPMIDNISVDLKEKGAYYLPGNPNTFSKDILGFGKKSGHSYFNSNNINAESVGHELGHQLTNGNEALPFHLTQDYLKSNMINYESLKGVKSGAVEDLFEYHTDPTEFKTRLDLLRQDLKKVGYDYMTQDLTENHLKLLEGKTPREVMNDLFPGKKFNELTDIQKSYIASKSGSQYEISTEGRFLMNHFPKSFLVKEANILPVIGGALSVPYILNKK